MCPFLTLFGKQVSGYGLMVVLGILAMIVYFNVRKHSFPVPEADVQLALICGGIGAFLGSKALYLLTVLPSFLSDLPALFSRPAEFAEMYLAGGFVFYGGVYGAMLAAFLYCRVCRISWWKMAECLVPFVPLFHVFGRLGCLMAGCCYGIEVPASFPLAIVFQASEAAPNGVPLFPTQIFEVVAELLLFFLTVQISRGKTSDREHGSKGRRELSLWLILYGAFRFFIEFFRGDAVRGFIGVLSTSQVLSLLSIALGLFFILRPGRDVITKSSLGKDFP